MPARQDSLVPYRAKRNFGKTPEPPGEVARSESTLAFVIQKHAATRLHYDFRLELDGVMLSWAVPRGPSYDPRDKRMAIQVEDHPISYNSFEGTIPPKQYGAGTVIIWDRGTWEPVGDAREGLDKGKLLFDLYGQKMAGRWELVRIAKPGERQIAWILFKKHDAYERPKEDYDVVTALPDSVVAKPLPPASKAAGRQAAAGAARGTDDIQGNATQGAKGKSATQGARGKSATQGAHGKSATQGAHGKSATQGAHGKSATQGAHGARAADDAETARDAGAATDDPSQLPGAAQAPLPVKLAPQLATLSTGLPADGDWLFEIKFDGYRLMTRIEDGKPRLITRGGHDWTSKMPGLAAALAKLGSTSAWLDGEIVVLSDSGTPDFNALQNAFDQRDDARIVYFLFDLPYLDGVDLRRTPLLARRALLRSRLEARPHERLRFSADFDADASNLLQSAAKLGLEGVIAKRIDAPYVSQRTHAWLKLKCRLRQEFVVGGYTDRGNDDAAKEVGSLLLGVHDDSGALLSVGGVGTGWDAATATALKQRLLALKASASPFGTETKPGRWTRRVAGSERWVKPKLVVEVSFAGWTPDGQVRHAVFEGVRADKPAKDVTRELAETPKGTVPMRSATAAATTKVSNPERVIDATSGATKLDLVRYYESVADWILPHLKGRPCSLVRAPGGIAGELFFQKHADKLHIPQLKELSRSLWPEHEPLLEIPTATALAGAAQMNVIEFHTWNALSRKIDKPDRMIFDLDPGDGVAWGRVLEAAALTRSLLTELGLKAWLKTSGGKGLHVVVPLAPRHGWDTVKGFSQAVVQHLAKVLPDRFVARSGPKNRVGKIFADYLRNGFGATTAAAYSARARPGLGVSMPVPWDKLESLRSGAQWTVATAREHLSFETADPWAGFWTSRQALGPAMKRLDFTPSD